jgi:ribosomal protein S18 acetylase RimI-like enzyme
VVTEIAQLSRDDWEIYRGARLAALEDSPSAFGSRLGAERHRTEAEWRDRLGHRTQFVARGEGEVLGTVGCLVDGGVAELVSMWVAPEARGSDVADQLVDAVLTHARERGCEATVLWVSDGNVPAERLYARRGFLPTGRTQPVDERDPYRGIVFEMRRDER